MSDRAWSSLLAARAAAAIPIRQWPFRHPLGPSACRARHAAVYGTYHGIRGVPMTIVVDQAARIRLVRPGRFTAAAGDSLLQFLAADSGASAVVAGR